MSTYVGVHIRRGDYKHISTFRTGGTLYNGAYFLRTMEKMAKHLGMDPRDLVFVVATDDPKWAWSSLRSKRLNIAFSASHYKRVKGMADYAFDFAVLVSCNHSIYDYGTFGFWSGYLAGGQVLLAKKFKGAKEIDKWTVGPILTSGLLEKRFHFI